MSSDHFICRKATIKDTGDILRLYKLQSKVAGRLTRDESEISKKYVEEFTLRSLKSSTQFVAIDTAKDYSIIGEIHCYKLEPKIYNHLLSDLTIAINPAYEGKGVDRILLETLIANITKNRSDILRIELLTGESNTAAVQLYESLGFAAEGRLAQRILSSGKPAEADIAMAWFNPKYRRR